MSTPRLPHTIASFRDALGLAFELGDQFPTRTHAFTLTQDLRVQSAVGADVTLEQAKNLLPTLRPKGFQGGHYLILSSSIAPLNPLKDSDVAAYTQSAGVSLSAGRTLLDWIVVDDTDALSFAYLLHPETAWLGDPLPQRLDDYQMMGASP